MQITSTKKIFIQISDSSVNIKTLILKYINIFTGLFLLLAIFFSFTNKIILYPVFMFWALLLLLTINLIQIQKVGVTTLWLSLISLGLYFFLSAVMSGVPINNILSYGFFRYDGNFFVAFFPLFFLPFIFKNKIKPKGHFLAYVEGIIWFISGVTLFLTITYLLHHPIGSVDIYGIYFYLFKAHNAAGSFYLVMFFINFLLLLNPKYKRSRLGNLISSLIFLVALLITKSRGSIFGLLLAFFVLIINNTIPLKKFRQIIISLLVLSLIIFNIVLLVWGYKGWIDLGKPTTTFFQEKALPSFLNTLSVEKYSRFENIADRLFYLWPRAIDDFFKSPLIGIGFTRFNDVPMYLEGIPYYLMLNTTHQNIQFNSAHAHNTFLHVMAETGIIGLFFLIVFIVNLFSFTKSINSPLSLGIYYAIWGMLGASFTEHRFFTPSGMLVISIFIIIAYLTRLENTKLK